MDIDSLWNYSDPEGTKQKFLELLDSPTEIDRSKKAEILTQIARCEGLSMNFEQAHHVLDEVSEMLTESMPTANGRYLLERGRVYNSSGNKEKAEELFINAWEFCKEKRLDFFAIDAAHMMGYMLVGSGNPDAKLNWELKALQLAEDSDQPSAKKWLGSLYNNLGWSYFEKSDFNRATELFEKCRDLHVANGKEDRAKIAIWSIARIKRELGAYNEALEMQMKLLDSDQGEDRFGYRFEEVAECLYALGREEESQSFFKKAYDKLSQDKWFVKNESERLNRLHLLSNTGENQ